MRTNPVKNLYNLPKKKTYHRNSKNLRKGDEEKKKKKKPISFPHYTPIKSYSNDCKTRRDIRLDTFRNFFFLILETRHIWIFQKVELAHYYYFLKFDK